MMLYDSNNGTDVTTGGGFTMVSTKGAISTYAMEATYAASAFATQTAIGPTESVQGPSPTGAAAISSPTTTASSTALTVGAKAGIAVGVSLLVIILAAIIYFDLRKRRRVNRQKYMVKLPSTSSTELVAPAEKPVAIPADPVAKSPRVVAEPAPEVEEPAHEVQLPTRGVREQADEISIVSDSVAEASQAHSYRYTGYTPLEPTPRTIFTPDENRRNSEDWRQFFKKGNVERPG